MTDILVKGKIVGNFELSEKTYYSTRKPEHFMVKYQGFGISQKVLDFLTRHECETVKIRYLGVKGQKEYTYKLSDFLNSEKTHTFEGEDLQKFVSI